MRLPFFLTSALVWGNLYRAALTFCTNDRMMYAAYMQIHTNVQKVGHLDAQCLFQPL